MYYKIQSPRFGECQVTRSDIPGHVTVTTADVFTFNGRKENQFLAREETVEALLLGPKLRECDGKLYLA